jgi:hypothetical protein
MTRHAGTGLQALKRNDDSNTLDAGEIRPAQFGALNTFCRRSQKHSGYTDGKYKGQNNCVGWSNKLHLKVSSFLLFAHTTK